VYIHVVNVIPTGQECVAEDMLGALGHDKKDDNNDNGNKEGDDDDEGNKEDNDDNDNDDDEEGDNDNKEYTNDDDKEGIFDFDLNDVKCMSQY
jgi:hypothetical protein